MYFAQMKMISMHIAVYPIHYGTIDCARIIAKQCLIPGAPAPAQPSRRYNASATY